MNSVTSRLDIYFMTHITTRMTTSESSLFEIIRKIYKKFKLKKKEQKEMNLDKKRLDFYLK